MSYWCVKGAPEPGPSTVKMQQDSPGEDMSPPVLDPDHGSTLDSYITLENIRAIYESGEQDVARELVQQACCQECSVGQPRIDGVDLLCLAVEHEDHESAQYLLKEAQVSVPKDPTKDHPALVAARCGHVGLVRLLLDALPHSYVAKKEVLLRSLLTTACQKGHLNLVKMLVELYNVDVNDSDIYSQEFTQITELPLYATAMAGHMEIASFLLQNGAGFSSYVLIDHPSFCKQLLRQRVSGSNHVEGDQSVRVSWSGLQLPWLELTWYMDLSSQITHLELSSNQLSALPSVVPWGLVHLQSLDLQDNLLNELPLVLSSHEVLCTSLREVNLSQNQLTSLPCGLLHLTHLQRLWVSKNQLSELFQVQNDVNWIGLRRLEELDVSENDLNSLPVNIMHCLKFLRTLNASNNKLKELPEPWGCPLKQCRASSNMLESLPEVISVQWRKNLQEMDFCNNKLTELPGYLFELEALVSLRLGGNQLSSLPTSIEWKCIQLRTLDLSHNLLGKSDDVPKSKRLGFLVTWTKREPEPVPTVNFPAMLRDSLEVLYLNDNQLEAVPPSVCGLNSLTELYLSNNPGIKELPVELGQLSNLWQLDLENLNITNVPLNILREGTLSVLAFLRAHLRKAEPCRLLKMVVIGPPRQGKTTLLEVLQNGRTSQQSSAPCGIDTWSWHLDRPSACKGNKEHVEFNVWDIGGKTSMSTVNHCFFTNKALYLVVWNLALGEEAVANLQTWLLSIEARAPNSAVVVVGTHLDLIDARFRTERLATLRAYVLALCRSPSGARATGFPDITCKNIHEVSCKTLEGVDDLRKLLFHVAVSMKDSSSPCGGCKLIGRLIPQSYLKLQEAVILEKVRRRSEGQVQYLTDNQLENLAQQSPDSDLHNYEDLQTAIGFLIDTGTLLHFPDTSHGLCTLYFLCPLWLSECLQCILDLKSTRTVIRNGVISTENLRELLVGTGFTQQTEEQYFQFLAKFEIALPVAKNGYLLPHLLPPKPALDIHSLQQVSSNTLQRLFKMSFVPAGFWERFIARMLISLTEMDLQSFEPHRHAPKASSRASVMYSFAGALQRSRCSTFRVRRRQTVYWREGLLVTFHGGHLSVESAEVDWKRKKSGGIRISCQSETRDFSAMAFITDHVNSLIDQWFPALTGTESDGSLLMEQYAPCPLCPPCPPGTEQWTQGHYFSMEDCVLAAVDSQSIVCPQHPEQPVLLQELVPEFFMTDFPSRLFLQTSDLEFSEEKSRVLGQGGSGTTIYHALYRSQPVALKMFSFRKFGRQRSSNSDTMLRHLQSADACRSFSEFRQEASMLRALNHPCIVSLLGISIHPLCFALQLAPLGSLNTVLEESNKRSGVKFIPLGHMLTFKMSYQIAAGLAYLHRKNIIFCDLKSDNILVWSLEVQEPVNIKLSDYGISRQSFREGALGVEGTPGYQAPEIRPGIVYDEKVDMFSYGMVLYELLSGQRPALGNHQLQISKKLSKGCRPALGRPEEVQFFCLQSLLTRCWDTKPERRPVAAQCVKEMQDPSFPCLKYVLSCGAHTQLFLSPLQGPSAVFWDGTKDERNYSVVNVDTGLVEVKRMLCPGDPISCQLKVGNSLWMATQEQEVLIYSLKDMCPLSQPQKHFPSPAVITSFLLVPPTLQSLGRVFAGMSDGLVAVYNLLNDLPLDGETYLCSHSINKALGVDETDLRQKVYPVSAMVLLGSDKELWYSNGPGILVIDCLRLQPIRRLEPYTPPSTIVSMTTSFCLWGQEAVWVLDDLTNTVLLYDAASYQLCAKYCCGDRNPLRDVFPVQHPTCVPTTHSGDPRDPSDHSAERKQPMDLMYMCSQHAGAQYFQAQDSVTSEESNVEGPASPSSTEPSTEGSISSSNSKEPSPQGSFSPSSSTEPHLNSPSSPSQEENNMHGDQQSVEMDRNSSELRAVTVLCVREALWIPRCGGDVLVLELQPGPQQPGYQPHGSKQLCGRVTAVLRPPEGAAQGRLQVSSVLDQDTVLCAHRDSLSQWTVCAWRAWGSQQLQHFYSGWEDLVHLENRLRKSRER
ncbi:leucine-rich repeat serine/threonine-protein kinase 1 isoform X2 [Periophthalmus magnuspinnatus]|uniref:leucine-rich repeat serine/threonine-protein kinase 1 isoform X2 n=1 Tax=Periophthalmus magnuspinnatus TaxID=409849 RepID=UPI00145B725E|nr:leucine-rich repeat serine/threonine-protein kinase 1 isoform X2 [Periophthalmus magnuspinnatus]